MANQIDIDTILEEEINALATRLADRLGINDGGDRELAFAQVVICNVNAEAISEMYDLCAKFPNGAPVFNNSDGKWSSKD